MTENQDVNLKKSERSSNVDPVLANQITIRRMIVRKWTTQPGDESHPELELPQTERNEDQTHLEMSKMKWIDLVTETRPWAATPIGPKYQADIPNWVGDRNMKGSKDWLGEHTWPNLNDKMKKRKWTTQLVDESHQELELPHIDRNEDQAHPEMPKMKWIDLVTETRPWAAIPIGPKYQSDIPNWTGDRNKKESKDWLGEQTWPSLNQNQEASASSRIGKGRPVICACLEPGSVECVNRHLNEKKNKLKSELGETFWWWKFDDMGEEVSKSWSSNSQRRFELLVTNNPPSKDKNFFKQAFKYLPERNRKSIINYYYNVFVPRRMSKGTRIGSTKILTDDEDKECLPEKAMSKGWPKLSTNKSRKYRYLTRRR